MNAPAIFQAIFYLHYYFKLFTLNLLFLQFKYIVQATEGWVHFPGPSAKSMLIIGVFRMLILYKIIESYWKNSCISIQDFSIHIRNSKFLIILVMIWETEVRLWICVDLMALYGSYSFIFLMKYHCAGQMGC